MALLWLDFMISFKGFWLVHSHYGRGIVDIMGSLGASLIVILISKYIFDRKGKVFDFLAFLGRNSIIFLAAHITEQNTFPWHTIISGILGDRETPTRYLYMVIILKLAVIICITCIFTRITFIRSLFGIKRKDSVIQMSN